MSASTLKTISLLVVEDSLTVTLAIKALLKSASEFRFEATFSQSMAEAISCIKKQTFDVILLDLGLPDSQGFETLKQVRNEVQGTPIVVLTSTDDDRDAMEAIQLGAQDYLGKDHVMRGPLLIRSLYYAVERRRLEEQMIYYATHDELTGTFTRRIFIDRLDNALKITKRYEAPISVCLCDIDDFKHINDTYGHLNGDLALQAFTKRLQDNLRETDIIGRFGGDEFCMLFQHTSASDAQIFLRRINITPLTFKTHDTGEEVQINTSFGIVEFDSQNMNDVKALLDAADRALYAAKAGGKNQVVIQTNSTTD